MLLRSPVSYTTEVVPRLTSDTTGASLSVSSFGASLTSIRSLPAVASAASLGFKQLGPSISTVGVIGHAILACSLDLFIMSDLVIPLWDTRSVLISLTASLLATVSEAG